jgi:hypothetical protein
VQALSVPPAVSRIVWHAVAMVLGRDAQHACNATQPVPVAVVVEVVVEVVVDVVVAVVVAVAVDVVPPQ